MPNLLTDSFRKPGASSSCQRACEGEGRHHAVIGVFRFKLSLSATT